ncbi:hypothetical protein CDL15_Pgr026831 [Punica granatum]|uniref:Uncharacterized protein n=1 Tax=Punica granatum TaxID=22663 RepID=A0A218WLK3_PUNGR|nr:hypothetical protein CDL15_Pgr026831 [Punica granatum]
MDDNNDSDGDDDYGPDDEIDYERLKEDEYRSDASNEESIEALRNLKLYSKSRREGRDFDYTEDISDYEVEQSDVAENDMGREAEQSMADQVIVSKLCLIYKLSTATENWESEA